jgi:replicative DNA helicase
MHVLLQANVESLLRTHNDIWEFTRNYYDQNQSIPPISIVKQQFPDFDYTAETGATKHHLDELRQDYLVDNVKMMLRAAATDVQEGKATDALDRLITETSSIKRVTSTVRDLDVTNIDETIAYFEHIKKMKESGNHGIYTGIKGFDMFMPSGIVPGQFGVLLAYPAIGKPATMETMIATPNGWVRNGDLEVGDLVIGSNGKPTKVVGINDQGSLDAYKVTLSDGASVVVGPDHDWSVYSRDTWYNSKTMFTKTTVELMESDLHYEDHRVPKRNVPTYKWYLPIVDAVEYVEKDLPVDPYTVGILVGDGSMTRETVYFTTNDSFCAEEIQRRNLDYVVNKNKGGSAERYSIIPRFMKKIRLLDLNKNSHNKRVPPEYLISGIQQRLDLLRGLMDSDGSVRKNNRAFFHSTNKGLAEDVQQLVWSLGGVAHLRSSDRSKEGKGIEYRVAIWTPENPFLLPRKAEKYSPRPWYRALHSIEKIGTDEMRCITVDAEDHLYVTENYIVTHNSWMALYFAVAAWKNGKTPLIVSLEMTESEVRNRVLTIIGNGMWSHRKLSSGQVEIDMFKKWAEKTFEGKPPIHIVSNEGIGEVSPSVVKGKIDQYKPDIVFLDYLNLMTSNQKTDNEVVKMKNLSRELKLLAISEQVPIIAISSATPDDVTNMNSVPTLGQTSWSRQIAYDADFLLALGRAPNSDVIECVFRKSRNGPLGDFLVQVDFDGGRFVNKEFA